MPEMIRRYDIGGGVMIHDNGHTLVARIDLPNGGGQSMGIKRPRIGPMPAELEVQFNENGKFFYLTGYFAGEWWLGVKAWDKKDEMLAQQPKGLMGQDSAEFISKAFGKHHWRGVLSFSMWKVDSGRTEMRPASDDMVQDYLILVQQRDQEMESRFNEVIAPSGKTLKWIMEKIGEWQPIAEIPVVVLT